MIVSDNGTELTGNAMLKWAEDNRVEWHYIAPGKPQQNGFMESFNGKLRDECLNEHVFSSLAQARPHHRSLAHRLQHRSPAFEPRLSDAGRVRGKLACRQPDAAPRPATGRAAAVLGASASRPVAGTPTAGQTENRLNL
jgi:putative transposase